MISERGHVMVKAAPPSPALSTGEMFHGLPSSFNDVQHYGGAPPYTRDHFPMDSFQPQSQPASRYSTPIPQTIPYQLGGLAGGHFPGYAHHMHPQEGSQYGPLPDETGVGPYSTPATSPPTPLKHSDVMTTRSGAMIPRQSRVKTLAPKPSRVEKAAPKKRERTKAPKRIAKLDKPMSELTKESPIPVADIETYVHRSAEDRHREVAEGKVPGKVKRPMNAFMLYRKAYQNRAKDWCSQHNHQIVSQVCGDSWPLEPEPVRAQFNEWARIERDNHQKAHPGYKFTPSKPQKAKVQQDDPTVSDAEDPDWVGSRSVLDRDRSMTGTPMGESDDGRHTPRSHYYHPNHIIGDVFASGVPSHSRSTFDYANPGKPMPSPYDPRDLPGHYYQTTHIRDPERQPTRGTIEDLLIHSAPSPSGTFYQDSEDIKFDMIGAPHGLLVDSRLVDHHHQHQHHHHYQQQQHQQPLTIDPRIDPSLLQSDGAPFDPNLSGYMMDADPLDMQAGWRAGHYGTHVDNQFSEGLLQIEDPMHTELLKGADDSWQVEPLDASHFDNWVENDE